MRDAVAELIDAAYSRSHRDTFCQQIVTASDREKIESIGRAVLEYCPFRLGACAPMSALWAARIEAETSLPAYVVAGDFYIHDAEIFYDEERRGPTVFESSLSDWCGHCWIVVGSWLGDASLFRTAYRRPEGSLLRQTVLQHFGARAGLLLASFEPQSTILVSTGFRYVPRFVLTRSQVDGLLLGAKEFFGL